MSASSTSTRWDMIALDTSTTTNANAAVATTIESFARRDRCNVASSVRSLDADGLHVDETRRSGDVPDGAAISRDELDDRVVVRQLRRRDVAPREDDLLPVALHLGDGP